MHPSRGGKARHARARKTMPALLDSSSLQPDAPDDVTPVQSPSHATHRTPQTAPQDRKSISKSRPLAPGQPASDVRKSFSTPSPATSHRKRSRTTDHDADDADASNQKGGHSLRKRARIDYSFEYIDDELGGRSKIQARSASRGRRRKTDADDDLEADPVHGQPRRATMGSWRDASPRRKNPARKTADQKSYAEPADDKDVLDTIEVGGRRGQSRGSPEDAEERKLHNGTASSSPREPERFVVEIPVPVSLRGRLGFPGFTKSPDLIEGSREPSEKRDEGDVMPAAERVQEPSEMKIEETEPPPLASEPIQEPDEKRAEEAAPAPTPAEPTQKLDEQTEHAEPVPEVAEPAKQPEATKAEKDTRSPTPVEPPAATESHSPKADARPASPYPDEVQPEREESPSETLAPSQTRRNSAPGKINPPSVGHEAHAAHERAGRPWNEFEDLNPGDESLPWVPTPVQWEPTKDAEVRPVGVVSSFDGAYSPESEARTTEPQPMEPEPMEPEPEHKSEAEAEPVPEPELEAETEPSPPPSPSPSPSPAQLLPEPSPVRSPEAEASAETRASSPPETPQKTPTPSPVAKDAALPVEDRLPRGTKVHTVTIETEESAEPAEAEPSKPVKPWSHLTPHLAGQWTMHPESRLPRAEAARASFDSKGSATPSSKPSAANVEAVVNGDGAATPQEADEEADEPIESVAASPRINVSTVGSPVPELNHATAASSPAAPDEDEAPEEAEEETPEEPPQTQRFYKYPRLRDPDDYYDVIQNFKDLPTEDLYDMCGFVDETLLALQKEYLMLGALVDDYENIERRRAHDEAYEQLEKRGDKVSRKTFVLKGYRAPMTGEEKETAYQRAQDRVQAAAYGFRYDSHQAKVGRQDPVLQRLANGDEERGPRRTLRSDPLRSAKATEAEEPAVPGKRIRKPREVFDPATVSRSSTPVGRRRRGKAVDEEEHVNGAENGYAVNGHSLQPEKPRRGRKRRADPDALVQETPGDTMPPPPPPKRVRRASSKALQAAEDPPTEHHTSVFPAAPEVLESVEAPPRKNQRIVTLKTKAGSFGALARLSAEEEEERPVTASSSNSEGWRRGEEEEPKGKRARKVTKRARESAAENMLLVPSIQDDPFVEVHPNEAKPRKPRIKVVKAGEGGGGVGVGGGVVSPGANGEEGKRKGRKPSLGAAAKAKKLEEAQGDLSAQEYAALSKSEKMSHSMKSRWASGSMQQAVDKRKATLAKKKAAKAAVPGEGSPEGAERGSPEKGQGFGVYMGV